MLLSYIHETALLLTCQTGYPGQSALALAVLGVVFNENSLQCAGPWYWGRPTK